MRSNVYVSPVIMYLPVSPVAPPKRTTLDFDTIQEGRVEKTLAMVLTLSDGVAETSKGNLAEDLYFLHHLLFFLI